jgi:hypothetical protein
METPCDRRTPRRQASADSISSKSRASRRGREGPYGIHALAYLDAGLRPIPCGGDDGKRPLVTFKGEAAPSKASVAQNLRRIRLRRAGIGVLTGAGERPVTVIDIDDPSLVEAVMATLGPTPIVVRTPRGGTHLYFRHQAERCTTLRPDLRIDIKGVGGFVVAPPTVREASPTHAGGVYRFERGSFDNLRDLPRLPDDWRRRLACLARASSPPNHPRIGTGKNVSPANTVAGGTIAEGARNDTLFKAALWLAPQFSSADEHAAAVRNINSLMCAPPLPEAEVLRAAASAWGYEMRGCNWARSDGVVQVSADEIKRLGSAEALWLLAHLRIAHGSRHEPFAVSPRAMAEHECIPGMGEHAIRRARRELVNRGFLVKVHDGGAGPRDPAKFLLKRA